MITNRFVLGRLLAACMIGLTGLSPAARAATYTWDADSGTTGPQDGAGTWDTTLENWWDGTTNIAWPDPNTADIARFGAGSGTAGTVTVGAVQANGLEFVTAGSGNYTLSSGTITLGGTSPTITTSASGASTIQSVIAGSGFTKLGAGTLTLSGTAANTFTGTTTVEAGTLRLEKSGGTRALGGDLVIDGGAVRFQATNQLATTASIQVNAGGIADVGNSGGQSLASVTHASTGTSNLSNWTLSGTLAVSNGTAEVNSSATSTFNTVNVSGGRLLLWAGGGDTTVNVGSGGLTLTGGTIRLGNSNNARVAKLTLGGDFTSDGGGVFEAGNATTRPQIELTGGQRTFTISGGTTTIDAGIAVTGAGGLAKVGVGILALAGPNSYSGATTISEGTLRLTAAGAIGASAGISVAESATFDVAGVTGGFVLGSGKSLGGAGTVLGSVSFGAESKFDFTSQQTLSVNDGLVTFANFSIADVLGISSATIPGTYTLLDGSATIDLTSGITNLGPEDPYDLGGGKTAYFVSGSLAVVVVPEPGLPLLAAVMATLALAWRLRHRQP